MKGTVMLKTLLATLVIQSILCKNLEPNSTSSVAPSIVNSTIIETNKDNNDADNEEDDRIYFPPNDDDDEDKDDRIYFPNNDYFSDDKIYFSDKGGIQFPYLKTTTEKNSEQQPTSTSSRPTSTSSRPTSTSSPPVTECETCKNDKNDTKNDTKNKNTTVINNNNNNDDDDNDDDNDDDDDDSVEEILGELLSTDDDDYELLFRMAFMDLKRDNRSHNVKNDWFVPVNHNKHKRDVGTPKVIKIWNRDERRFAEYLVLHTFWNSQNVNSYVVKQPDVRRIVAKNGQIAQFPPTIKATLRIFYTIDVSSLSTLKVDFLSVLLKNTAARNDEYNNPVQLKKSSETVTPFKSEHSQRRRQQQQQQQRQQRNPINAHKPSRKQRNRSQLPSQTDRPQHSGNQRRTPNRQLENRRRQRDVENDDIEFLSSAVWEKSSNRSLEIINVRSKLSVHERVTIIRQAIIEAFDAWNTALNDIVHFEYIPYTERLKESEFSDKIIVVSATNIKHKNEHNDEKEEFSSDSTLAHAYVNILHLNDESSRFFLGPHEQRQKVELSVPIIDERGNTYKMRTVTIPKETARERMGFQSNWEMNRYLSQATSLFLRKQDYRYTSCLFCTLLHEIAHILGLGHCNLPSSLMYDTITTDDQKIRHTDVLAMKILYKNLIQKEAQTQKQIDHLNCRDKSFKSTMS